MSMNGGVVFFSLIGLLVFAVSFIGNFVEFTQSKSYSALMWAILMFLLMMISMMMIAVNTMPPVAQ